MHPFADAWEYPMQYKSWREPALAFGIVHDIIRNVWARRPPLFANIIDMECIEINDVAVNRLALATLKLSKINFRAPGAIEKWCRNRGVIGISDHMYRPRLANDATRSEREYTEHRYREWVQQPAHAMYSDIRACARAIKVKSDTSEEVFAMPSHVGPLRTIRKDDVQYLEMRWRLKDCATGGKKRRPLQGQRRAAWEAIWLAGEHARAYEFVGVQYPGADGEDWTEA